MNLISSDTRIFSVSQSIITLGWDFYYMMDSYLMNLYYSGLWCYQDSVSAITSPSLPSLNANPQIVYF